MYDVFDQQTFNQVIEVTDQQSAVLAEAFAYHSHLTGWCSQDKCTALINLILATKPEKVVEIGVWGGSSLVPMATALRANKKGVIYGIDPWDTAASSQYQKSEPNYAFWSQVDHLGVLRQLEKSIRHFSLQNQIQLIRKTSQQADPIQEIDILHIDGNHSEETSFADVTKWVPLVKKGGFIIFDDVNWCDGGKRTTLKAVNYLDQHCQKVAEYFENENEEICQWAIWIK